MGNLKHTDALHPSAAGTNTKVFLRRSDSESDGMARPKSYDEWKAEADEILKLRGPKW
jgi:hypothetical protein